MIGCSSFTLKTLNGTQLLSRTMDFATYVDSGVVVVPKGFKLNYNQNEQQVVQHRFLGMANLTTSSPAFYDGVNEHGLAGATLYYPGFATYQKQSTKTSINPLQFISYMLGQAKNIEEVEMILPSIDLINEINDILPIVPPLHFIYTDKSGKTLIIEPDQNQLTLHKDSIGVMTNSPNYQWHETNLRNYIGINPNQLKSVELNGKTFKPFGQGSGTVGMPGDYTPPARFVRVAYLKEYAKKATTELEGVTTSFHILASVDIPKGIVLNEQGNSDYTVYTSSMSTDSSNYYFASYDNRRINKVNLFNEDLTDGKLKKYPLPMEQDIHHLN